MSSRTAPDMRALLLWYDEHRRALPWREEPSPYHVWLSEIMLQQTRVEAVLAYYRRFLSALPDIAALAAAPEERVLKLWEGLGYYSRGRNLHSAAVRVMEEYGGEMPASQAALQKLPGIGRYTSAAIASIAFGGRAAAVDGNLLRIFARLAGYGDNIRTGAALKDAEAFWLEAMDRAAAEAAGTPAAADASGDSGRNYYGDCNQALMDLGSAVCVPNAEPGCGACPFSDSCAAHAAHREREFPVVPPRRQRRIEERTVFVIHNAECTALRRRPDRGLLAGLYELPNTEGKLEEKEALAYIRELGLRPLHLRALGPAVHVFTHLEWHMTGYEVRVDELEPAEAASPLLFVRSEDALRRYSIPSAFGAYYSLWQEPASAGSRR